MFQVNNKFEVGETCYTYYRKPVPYRCPICDGNGSFIHNGYDIWCRNCKGTGNLHDSRVTTAEPCSVKVRSIKVKKDGKDKVTVKYVVDPDEPELSVKNRTEETMFPDPEQCEVYCRKINQGENPAPF